MELFRISREQLSHTISSSGSPNRWNRGGQFVIYAGSSRSLATLELLVHKKSLGTTGSYKVMVISVEDNENLVKQILIRDLPVNWQSMGSYPFLQGIGSAWYSNLESLILKVPSAVISREYNYIINTMHPEYRTAVQHVKNEDYFWDSRLFG